MVGLRFCYYLNNVLLQLLCHIITTVICIAVKALHLSSTATNSESLVPK